MYCYGAEAWVHRAVLWLLPRHGRGMIDFSCELLLRGMCALPVLNSFLDFLGVRIVSGDVTLVFAMKEAVLPSRLLVLISVPGLVLIWPLVTIVVLRSSSLVGLWGLVRLLLALLGADIE